MKRQRLISPACACMQPLCLAQRGQIQQQRAELRAVITHIQNDSFLQQALFFGSHHKVMRVILVVDDVFQVNT